MGTRRIPLLNQKMQCLHPGLDQVGHRFNRAIGLMIDSALAEAQLDSFTATFSPLLAA